MKEGAIIHRYRWICVLDPRRLESQGKPCAVPATPKEATRYVLSALFYRHPTEE